MKASFASASRLRQDHSADCFINGNLDTLQFAGIAIDSGPPDIAFGGPWDNGDSRFDDSLL